LNKIKWIIFTIITVGIFVTLIIISDNSKIDVSKIDVNAIQTASKQNGNIADHVYGNPDSKVTLINYGDFQCPGCGNTHPMIKKTVETYKDKIRFVFRNVTLSYHANAKAASATAEAAGLQGKYWEMFNKIYESQSDWSELSSSARTPFFEGYAKNLGLDIAKFKVDISSSQILSKINYDIAVGKKADVNSTPTFILNGKNLDSSVWGEQAKLIDAINAELIKNGIELPATTE